MEISGRPVHASGASVVSALANDINARYHRGFGDTSRDPNIENAMNEALEALIKAAKTIEISPEQRELQRRSFAYGNTRFENSLITREMVDQQAERLKEENEPDE